MSGGKIPKGVLLVGAGAMVLETSEDDDHGLLDCLLHSDGKLWDKMWVRGGGSAFRPYFDAEALESGHAVPIALGLDAPLRSR